MTRIDSRALVVLAGPSGAGKSTWAKRWFASNQIVASDDLRAVVGDHEADLRAGGDAFDVLDLIVERRLARGLLTVVDTLGMDVERHKVWQALAKKHKRPTHLLVFATDDKTCRSRNRTRAHPVPSKVLTAQLAKWTECRDDLGESFDTVTVVDTAGDQTVSIVPSLFAQAAPDGDTAPPPLRFGLSVSAFDWGDKEDLAERLGDIAVEAEEAGFSSLWVMDHFIQIPQVGREWEPMLDSWTTLGYLAARTTSIRLGTLVTGITYRSIGHVAKLAATLDVLSGGRVTCGLGAAWFEREHAAYGYDFPAVSERFKLLEDALQVLPLYWGSGAPAFEGAVFSTPETTCYPRPIQDPIPILVGGSGEKRTLRLVAEYADACNLFGDEAMVTKKLDVLRGHCTAVGRSINDIAITHLSTALSAGDDAALAERVDALRPERVAAHDFARSTDAAPVDAQIDRYRRLAAAGVQEAIVSLADVGHAGSVRSFAPVIAAFDA